VPLAEAVVFAMLASYVISRTLVPTLVMWFYRSVSHTFHDAHEKTNDIALWRRPFAAIQTAFENRFNNFRESYRLMLGAVLHYRVMFTSLFLLFCAATFLLVPQLGQDFFPVVDAGHFRLHIRTRSGTRVEETAKLVAQIETVIRREIPDKDYEGMLDNIGMPNSSINLLYNDSGLIGSGDADILVALKKNHSPTSGYVDILRKRLPRAFPGVSFYFLPADIVSQSINFGLPAPFDIQIVGRNQDKNREVAARLIEKIRHIPGAVDVRLQQPADLQMLHFEVNRTQASEMNLSEQNVANSVLLSQSGSSQIQPAYWVDPLTGVQYAINVRVPEYNVDSIERLNSIPINGSKPGKGDEALLGNLSTVTRTNASPIYSHYGIMPVIDIFGGVSGRDLGSVLKDINPLVKDAEKELPKTSFIQLRGQAETMHASFVGLSIGMVGAMLLIYLLLVVNFQKWLDPFIIITALPGALAGVVWALHLSLTTISVPALMGAIMCLGVATANSVLVVTFARNNLEHGMDPITAAWEAGVGRLRPVLMTATAMIIGMLPMALALGEGGEQNAPLGRAVIGGLIVATFATLFFVPVVFSLLRKQR